MVRAYRSHMVVGTVFVMVVGIFVNSLLTHCTRVALPKPTDPLVAEGRDLFFDETFGGNGRTCGSCHPAGNNFTIDPVFIATLPNSDPLFVAEFDTNLKNNFENPRLMREFGLIIENLDGFEDLDSIFTQRGVPHTLALQTSVDSQDGPRTGWSGDGAPGDGSLRAFSTGAVIQHFTKTLNRVSGVDFRLPTEEELDALEAFMLSLGRREELELPLPLVNPVALEGQAIFNDIDRGKCFVCHANAGANVDPSLFGEGAGNLNFNTGVEDLPGQPARLTGELIPPDDGFGTPGDGTFNTPALVEAADTPPFFHNNAIVTLEGAVDFYDSETFNNSPAGQTLLELTGSEISLEPTEVEAIAAFLRVINALENIRQSTEFIDSFLSRDFIGNELFEELPGRAADEIGDAIQVLSKAQLHPVAVVHLRKALVLTNRKGKGVSRKRLSEALKELDAARKELVNEQDNE